MTCISRRTLLFRGTTCAGYLVLVWHRGFDLHGSPAPATIPDSLRFSLFGMSASSQIQQQGKSPTEAINELTVSFSPLTIPSPLPASPIPSSSLYGLARSPEANAFSFNAHDVAHGLGIVGQIAAVALTPYIGAGYAIAAQIGGILVEPTLNFVVDHPDLNNLMSGTPFLSSTPPAELNSTTATLAALVAERYQNDPGFAHSVDVGPLRTHLGLDFSTLSNDGVLLGSAANVTSNPASPILGALKEIKASQAENAKAIQKMQAAVDDSLKKYQSLVIAQSQQASNIKTEAARAARLEELRQQSQEFVGLSNIASFVVGTMLGNPTAAKAISTTCNSINQIYQAVGQFDLKAIGGFALAGTMVGAAGALFSIISSPSDPVLQAFDVINKKLDLILHDLDFIKQQQAQLIADVRDLTRLVQSNFAEATARLSRIEIQVNAMRAEILTVDRQNHQKEFLDGIDYCTSSIRNKDWIKRPGDFRDRLTALYSYGIHTSKLPSLTGDPNFSPTISDFAQALRARGYVDLSFGLLPTGASVLGINILHGGDYDVPESGIYANPVCWAMAANAYLEARMATAQLSTQDDQKYVPTLWNEGMRLRDVVRACTSTAVKSKMTAALEPLAGVHADGQRITGTNLISIDEHTIQDFQTNELTPKYQLQTIDFASIRDGRTGYGTGPEQWAISKGKHPGNRYVKGPRTKYIVTHDPVELAIAAQVIERKNVPFSDSLQWYINNGGGAYPLSASQLLIKIGPRAGQYVGGPDARLFETDATSDPTFKQRARAWNPLESRSSGQDPIPLFDECFNLPANANRLSKSSVGAPRKNS